MVLALGQPHVPRNLHTWNRDFKVVSPRGRRLLGGVRRPGRDRTAGRPARGVLLLGHPRRRRARPPGCSRQATCRLRGQAHRRSQNHPVDACGSWGPRPRTTGCGPRWSGHLPPRRGNPSARAGTYLGGPRPAVSRRASAGVSPRGGGVPSCNARCGLEARAPRGSQTLKISWRRRSLMRSRRRAASSNSRALAAARIRFSSSETRAWREDGSRSSSGPGSETRRPRRPGP